jgi:hypothetical protein
LDEAVLEQGIEMIAPHRKNRKNKRRRTQDGRKLRRYKRRWSIERVFAWLENFRRLVVRSEYKDENFLGMEQLVGCISYSESVMRWLLAHSPFGHFEFLRSQDCSSPHPKHPL